MSVSQRLVDTRFVNTLGGRKAPSQPDGVPRLLAAVAALALNTLLWLVLTLSANGSRHFRPGPSQTLLVFFVDNAKSEHAHPENLQPLVHHHTSHMQPTRAGLETSPVNGPPTETPEYLVGHFLPDGEAIVRDAPALRGLCVHTYPVELTSDIAMSAEIGLRVFVMPDGRIGQGTVVRSSGDQHLDLLTLKCLQANARLETQPDSSTPNGSWQRLTWLWLLP